MPTGDSKPKSPLKSIIGLYECVAATLVTLGIRAPCALCHYFRIGHERFCHLQSIIVSTGALGGTAWSCCATKRRCVPLSETARDIFRPLSEAARDTTEPLIVICGVQLKMRRFAPSFESIQAPTSCRFTVHVHKRRPRSSQPRRRSVQLLRPRLPESSLRGVVPRRQALMPPRRKDRHARLALNDIYRTGVGQHVVAENSATHTNAMSGLRVIW